VIVYRNCDPRFPFLWEIAGQPASRWNAAGDGPVQYLADTPAGAWAEFVRQEEITDPEDLDGINRALWAVDIGDEPLTPIALPAAIATGDPESTYPQCQAHADTLRSAGAAGLSAPSAALQPGQAAGYRVEGGYQPGPARDGTVIVLFGRRPKAVGWAIVDNGYPPKDLLGIVRHK
jgi:hypothetical protein